MGNLPDRDERADGVWADVRDRLDELRAVLPDLADLPAATPENSAELLLRIAKTTEHLRRRVIRDRIQRASLRELMQALLRSHDPHSILDTLTGYLKQVLDADEVVLVRRSFGNDGWSGHRTGRDAMPGRMGPVEWFRRSVDAPGLPGSEPAGDVAPGGVDGASDADGGWKHDVRVAGRPFDLGCFTHVLPLESAPRTGEENGECLGYLCVASGPEPFDEEWNSAELARRVAGMLETLRHREEMEGAHAFRRQLLEAMEDGVLAVDEEGRLLELNVGAQRYVPAFSPGSGGETLDELARSVPNLARHLSKALAKKSAPPPRELLLATAERKRVPVNVAVSMLRDPDGSFRGFVVNLTDLTPVREMEHEIERLDRLAALGRFAAGVAHEIRNPLAGIRAGVDYICRRFGPNAPETSDVAYVTGEIERLNAIVTDLLDYTHPRPLDLQPVRARELVDRVRVSLEPIFEERKITYTRTGPNDLELWADPHRLGQVLLNLVKNAAEASPEGGTVEVTWEGGGAGEPVRFTVSDEGPGWTEEQRRRAFEPFFTTKGEGTGLGLYLSHSIVEQHHGRLVLSTRGSGIGAVVSVELPATEQEGIADHEVLHSDR